jgi:hypothetical protein
MNTLNFLDANVWLALFRTVRLERTVKCDDPATAAKARRKHPPRLWAIG